MIAYCLTKNPDSFLLEVQKRLWRAQNPQAEFVVVPTPKHRMGNPIGVCDRILSLQKSTGHRYAVIFHEDCLAMREINPEEILQGNTVAARANHDNTMIHPARTWMVSDCEHHKENEPEKFSVKPYATRPPKKEDGLMDCDGKVLASMEWCEPCWLHLDSWYKHADTDAWKAKRDWVFEHFKEYTELPKLTTRMLSFATAVAQEATAVAKGVPHLPTEKWLERLAICEACEAYNRGYCSHCGCGMRSKSRMRSQDCPVGKWPRLQEES